MHGKSTVGHLLARRLQWDHVDTDDLVTQRAGRTVVDLFRDLGGVSAVGISQGARRGGRAE